MNIALTYMEKLTKEEAKQAMKDALNEWLDKQFAIFGRWTVSGLVSSAIAALAYAYSKTHGVIK
jgi:hypothetical protein